MQAGFQKNKPLAGTKGHKFTFKDALMLTEQKEFFSLFHRAAVVYIERFKLDVIPLVPGNKNPITKNGVKDASCDRRLINSWWSQWPEANIGIACGPPGPTVIDIDQPVLASLAGLEGEFGKLPETPQVITGKRGIHFYFNCSEPTPNFVKFRSGVDIRSSGSYVVAPPSRHPNGTVYQWDLGSHIKACALAGLPPQILQALKSRRSTTSAKAAGQTPLAALEGGCIAEGGRNDFMCRLAGSFLRQYDVAHAHTMLHAINQTHCRPPLSHTEVERIYHSVARMEVQRRGGGQ